MTSAPQSKNILLIGCGNYARDAHLPALAAFKSTCRLVGVVDIGSRRTNVAEQLDGVGLSPACMLGTPDAWKDSGPPGAKTVADWMDAQELPRIDAAIVSTYGVCHYDYLKWALERGLHVLSDKPLTVTPNCGSDPVAARQISTQFAELTALAQSRSVLFMLATQRRYQPHYREIAARLHHVFRRSGQPVTFCQCYTNDGWWVDECDYLIDRSYDPTMSGGGKLTHTGYHLLDIVPWLMRHCEPDESTRRIQGAKVRADAFRPQDAIGNVAADEQQRGEINASVQMAFHDTNGRTRCLVQFGMLHEGFSLKDTDASPETHGERRSNAAKGRTKQEFMTLNQGPVHAVWLRRIAKLLADDSRQIGGRAHLEVAFAKNPHCAGGGLSFQPCQAVYEECDELPTTEFLAALEHPQPEKAVVHSLVADHRIGVDLLAACYESMANGETAERVFNTNDWLMPAGAETYI